jgi:putative copper export protein/mono/diheme cytochrome c family protein/peroxiredoxin
MKALLLGAVSIHLASSVLLVGALFLLLLAGPAAAVTIRRWERSVVLWSRALVLIAIVAGLVWLVARTAVFENRPGAALEPRAIWHAALDTWPGLVWLARQGALVVLAALLWARVEMTTRRDWIAARAQALALAGVALGLASAASHAAAIGPGAAWAVAVDVSHVIATGLWVGGLPGLALLLHAAGRADDAQARATAHATARRFSHAALVAVLVLVATGSASAVAQVGSVAALVGTTHGHLLLAKLALLIPILALAAVNRARLLPAADAPGVTRRLATFVTLEALLALAIVALAAAMTLTTPARHAEPVWPFPFRLTLDGLDDVGRRRVLVASQLGLVAVIALLGAPMLRRRRVPLLAGAGTLAVVAAAVGVPPLVVEAYPTTFRRPSVTYHATSIASGMAVYAEHCASCHGADGAGPANADLTSPSIARRHAGELFWLVGHGIPERGMPAFDSRLAERARWDVINFVRALGAAAAATTLGSRIRPDDAWLAAPDFTIAVGPLPPGALRDYRGRRNVLLVVYTLPASRERMKALAQSYELLSILGVEIVAVPARATGNPIVELGAAPPVLFPVVTDGSAAIVATYRLFAPRPHAEVLIDRQGYVRAVWRDEVASADTSAVQAEVERLNAEKSPPPFPDDHVH